MNMNLLRHVYMEGEAGDGAGGGAGAAGGDGDGDGAGGQSALDAGSGDGDGAGGGDGTGGTPPALFTESLPEDWRAQALKSMGLDETTPDFDKRLKQLDRVSDFSTMTKNYFEAQDRIRKGEISSGLPENATDEQMTEWREANGVPQTADAYELQLEEGLVLGEDDTRIMSNVFAAAHAFNVPAAAMSEMTNAMMKSRQTEAEAIVSQDGIDAQTTTRQIKEAWGGDYQTNINIVTNLTEQLPESVRDAFKGARMADGKLMFNSPEVMVAMADWARKLNPSATVVPNANNPVQSINDEIKTLEAKMGTDDWHKDKESQDRYLALLDARAAMG